MQTENENEAGIEVGTELGTEITAVNFTPSPLSVALGTLSQVIQMVQNLGPSRDNSVAITKLEEAQMWLERGAK